MHIIAEGSQRTVRQRGHYARGEGGLRKMEGKGQEVPQGEGGAGGGGNRFGM